MDFLVLSGLATGASWLCYFKALQLGNINKVVPIDKSSIILTMLLAFIFCRKKNQFVGYDWYCFNNGRYFYDDRKKRT